MKTVFIGAAAAALAIGLAGPAASQGTGAATPPAGGDVGATTMAATGCNEPNLRQLRTQIDATLRRDGGSEQQAAQDAYRLLAQAEQQLAAGDIQACGQTVSALNALIPGVAVGAVEEGAAPPGAVRQAITGQGGEGLGVAPGEEEILLVRACRSGDFSYWRTRLLQMEDSDGMEERERQQAFQLLANAQAADSYEECAQSIALLEDLAQGITVGAVTGIETGSGVTLPGGISSDVIPNPAVGSVPPSAVDATGVADIQDACRTGNFAAWRIRIQNVTGDGGTEQQVNQDAFRLLAEAQDEGGQLTCEQALAALDSMLPGVEVGTLSREETTFPPGAIPGPVQSDVAVPEQQQ